MASDGHDLVRGAARLGESTGGRLAQAVCVEADRQAGFTATVTKPISESGWRKRLAARRYEEREIIGRSGVENGLQIAVDWDPQGGSSGFCCFTAMRPARTC